MNRYKLFERPDKSLLIELEEFKTSVMETKKHHGGAGWDKEDERFPAVMAILEREFKKAKPTLATHTHFFLRCYPWIEREGIKLSMASLGGINPDVPEDYYESVFIPYEIFK